MAETTLQIRATLTGKVKDQLGALRREFSAWHQQQALALRDNQRVAQGATRVWGEVASGAGKATSALGALGGALVNVKTIMAGVVAVGASGPIYEKLIGSNADLERARTTFNVLVGDTRKAAQLIAEVRKYAAETPFGESELIEGSKRLLRLTGQNAEQNMKLLKLAGQMAAINPSKTIDEAVEAILDAEGMEFERLKEFGIKLKSDDVKRAKKRGETLGQAALRGFEEQLTKQTGGRDVVGALGGTFAGQVSTLSDGVSEAIRKAGEPAFEVFKRGLGDLSKQLNNLESDPKLREEFEGVQAALKGGAEWVVSLVRDLPQAVAFARALRDEVSAFAGDNAGALKVGAGLFAANKLTGGALGAGVASGASRLLFGRGGAPGAGGAAGALDDAAAMPVRVVNWPVGGLPGGSLPSGVPGAGGGATPYMTRNTGGRGFLSTARAFGGAIAGEGAVATLGVGGTAAGGGILALFGAAAAIQLDVMRRTQGVVDAMERREKLEAEALVKSRQAMRARDAEEAKARSARNATTFGVRGYFDAGTAPGAPREERQRALLKGLQAAQLALGGSDAKVAGAKGSEAQQRALEEVNASVAPLGLRFGLSAGKGGRVGDRLRLFSGEQALGENDRALVEQFREINRLGQQNPAAFQALSSTPEFKRLNSEANRIREQVGRGNLIEGEVRQAVSSVEIGKIEISFQPGTDPRDAQVVTDQLTASISKAMQMVKQR